MLEPRSGVTVMKKLNKNVQLVKKSVLKLEGLRVRKWYHIKYQNVLQEQSEKKRDID